MKPLSPRGRALIDAALEADRPTARDRARIRAALAAQVGAAVLPAASSSLAAPAPPAALPTPPLAPVPVVPPPLPAIPMLGGLGVKLVAAGALIGAVGLGAGVISSRPSGPAITATAPRALEAPRPALDDRSPPPAQATAAAEAAEEESAAPSAEPRPTDEKSPPEKPKSARAPAAAPPSPAENEERAKPPAPRAWPTAPPRAALPEAAGAPSSGGVLPSHASSLTEETALLREAQAALKEGDAAKSLAAVDALAARHPQGLLREERLAARVLALCAAGRVEEARVEGQRFVAEMPRSIQAERVRASCAFAPSRDR
jgi:hypothetical protein